MVRNDGNISTPDGQAILGAASNAVYLAASTDPSLRGLYMEVQDGQNTGTVINGATGQITAERGNITLAGLVVNQRGKLSATTSVSANGSIYLIAGNNLTGTASLNTNPLDPDGKPTAFGGMLPDNGGQLVLGAGSVTQVTPDTGSDGTITGTQLASFIGSQVELAARNITLEGNAAILAPGGSVNAYASSNPRALVNTPTKMDADTDGTIYLDSASVIDVSGLENVAARATDNIIAVTLETNDLQDDPLLRDGFLHGSTVYVDVTRSPTLFDITPTRTTSRATSARS
ncbi:MAG: hypothetical protein WDO12_07525 [Pseudomonadota bacterium]